MATSNLEYVSINKFTGKNYPQWKFQLKCALMVKGLYGYVDGTIKNPAADKTTELEKYCKEDAMELFLISYSVDYNQIRLIESCNSAAKAIEKLNSVYKQKSESFKMVLLEKFHNLNMKKEDSVIQYITKVENLAHELKDAEENSSETAIITKVLSTLPMKFRNFSQAWLSMEETLQTLSNLTSQLLDEESTLTVTENFDTALSLSKSYNNKRIVCYNCKKSGHLARFCKEKVENKTEKHNTFNYKSKKVAFGDNSELKVTRKGRAEVRNLIKNQWTNAVINEVFYIPELKRNLLSEGVLTGKGKQHKSSFKSCEKRGTGAGGLIYCDVGGPLLQPSTKKIFTKEEKSQKEETECVKPETPNLEPSEKEANEAEIVQPVEERILEENVLNEEEEDDNNHEVVR
ncbi:hypothetical protein ILUMI_15886 [Ignelater luminosus]|uniref:CCHC-type domain-containing protein n=1 Tax=Ignelater luminosus TaxID=2038154 RepID=A0A8K0CTY0_IGNLU|nr:hypothetical protein ILUMI_15886 [Ignelater luminosus]